MGDKKPSIRTLSTGEKVTHYPDGRMVLVPSNRLEEQLPDDISEAEAALTEAQLKAVEDKRERQLGGDPVPSDKTPL